MFHSCCPPRWDFTSWRQFVSVGGMGNLGTDLAAGSILAVLLIVLYIAAAVVGFVVSAWIMSLYIRLVLRFLRRTLDREYRYARGDYSMDSHPRVSQRQAGPRDW